MMKRIIHNSWSWILIVLVATLFFWKFFIGGLLPIPADALVGMYHPFRDYFASQYPQGVPYKNFLLTDPVLQQYPWKWLAIESWKQGEVPFENPYNFSGTSLFANIQAGVFYPLNILFFLGRFDGMWSWYIMIQPVLAATFMTLWLRSLKLHPLASIFGGVVWAFSSFNIVWLEWGNVGHAGLWLPLALYSINRIKSNFQMKWILLLTLAMSMSLLAGHLQITLYVFITVALYWLIRLGISKKSILLFTIYCLLFTVATSFQWIPTLQFTLTSNRSVEQQDALTREGFFIRPRQLAQLFAPDFFGNPATGNYRGDWNYAEQIVYVGIIPLVLALSSFQFLKDGPSGKDRPYKICRELQMFALFLVIGGLLFSVKNPIAELPYTLKLPILSDLQPTRLSYAVTFGLSILASLGLHNFIKSPKEIVKKIFMSMSIVIVVLIGLVIFSSKFDIADKSISQRNLIMPAVLLVCFFIIIAIRTILSGRTVLEKKVSCLPACIRVSEFAAGFLLIVSCADLFRFGWKFTPFSPQEYLYPVTPAIAYLQQHSEKGDRYMTLDRRILPPNANIMYGLETIEGYDPIYSKAYAQKMTEMETGNFAVLPRSFGRIVRPFNYQSSVAKDLGVRYILSLSDIADQDFRLVFREGELRVYEKK